MPKKLLKELASLADVSHGSIINFSKKFALFYILCGGSAYKRHDRR